MPRSGPGAGDRLALDHDSAGLDRQEAAEQIEQRAICRSPTARAVPGIRGSLTSSETPVERQHRPAARRPIGVADLPEKRFRYPPCVTP